MKYIPRQYMHYLMSETLKIFVVNMKYANLIKDKYFTLVCLDKFFVH